MEINASSTNFKGNMHTPFKWTYQGKYKDYVNSYSNHMTLEEISNKKKDIFEHRNKQEKRKNQIVGASKLAGIMAAIQLIKMLTASNIPTLDGHGNNLKEAAEYMDAPVEIVEIVNNADEEDILDKYIVPQKYNGLDVAIEKCEKGLEDENITSKEKNELKKVLKNLEDRRDKLEEMGEVYIDPKTDVAYISLNDSYKAEEVKEVLGITKEGEFKDDTTFTWGTNKSGPEAGKGYMDYSNSNLSGIVDCDVDAIHPAQK